jgi:cobaltochelatase CobT
MTAPSPLDHFRTVLAGTGRIAQDPEVEVAFASEAGAQGGRVARVMSPGRGLAPRLVAEARGAADAVALRLRHHDAPFHSSQSSANPEARAVFDALEGARVGAIGARVMAGVRDNLAELAEARVHSDAITRAHRRGSATGNRARPANSELRRRHP